MWPWLRWLLRVLAPLAVLAHFFLIRRGVVFGTESIQLATAVVAALMVGAAATFPVQTAVGLATLAGAVYGALILTSQGSDDAPTAAACPGAQIEAVAFLGTTHPTGVNARTDPGRSFSQTRRYQGNCSVGFDGYCLGEPVIDIFTFPRVPDHRWLALPDNRGYVAAGVVRAQRAWSALQPMDDCPTVAPTPRTVRLSAPSFVPAGEAVPLEATAPGAALVGFAAYVPDAPEHTSKFLRLGLIPQDLDLFGVADTFRREWSIFETQAAHAPATEGVVVAVACYAAEIPSRLADGWTYRWTTRGVEFREPGRFADSAFANLDDDTRDRVLRTACLLPQLTE